MLQLRKELQKVKGERAAELNGIERERAKVTEGLRREMLFKIKETKASMMAMADEQAATTTRLNLLQNQQLTSELEYQSKQTEQLLATNQKLQKRIEALTRDVHIHQSVEKELAKRSHFSQKIIKRLKERVRELEGARLGRALTLQQDQLSDEAVGSHSAEKLGWHRRRAGHSLSVLEPIDPSSPSGRSPKSLLPRNNAKEGNNDLVQLLETKIEQVEDQLNQAQLSYSDLQTEYRGLQEKLT